jgi:hypothetical protein
LVSGRRHRLRHADDQSAGLDVSVGTAPVVDDLTVLLPGHDPVGLDQARAAAEAFAAAASVLSTCFRRAGTSAFAGLTVTAARHPLTRRLSASTAAWRRPPASWVRT